MDLKLKGKVIIVTGGSWGIGKSICEALLNEGAIPVIIDKNKEVSQKFNEELSEKGLDCFYVIAELTDEAQCKSALKKITARFKKIDGLINNAGVNDNIGLTNGTTTSFIDSLKKNVVHYFTMAQLCLPYLKKSKGAIVNIGSKVASTGQGGTSGYASANGGRNALTREWAVELLPYRIRVNSVIVAECMTPLYEKWLSQFENPEQKLNQITSKIPLESRMTTSTEVADTAVFLLSEKSSHTTGQILYVDGGYTHLDRSIT